MLTMKRRGHFRCQTKTCISSCAASFTGEEVETKFSEGRNGKKRPKDLFWMEKGAFKSFELKWQKKHCDFIWKENFKEIPVDLPWVDDVKAAKLDFGRKWYIHVRNSITHNQFHVFHTFISRSVENVTFYWFGRTQKDWRRLFLSFF